MTSTGSNQTQTRAARSSSLDGSVCTVSSIPSIPSIQVSQSVDSADEWENSKAVPLEVELNMGEDVDRLSDDNNHHMKAVSVDHERQVLLLFLLAQVCALHDPTPRTFTVHILGLFEQGILDREAIQFLFELGFVPSSTIDSRGLLTSSGDTSRASTRGSRKTRNRGRPKYSSSDPDQNQAYTTAGHDSEQIELSTTAPKDTTDIVKSDEIAIAGHTNVLHNVNDAVPGVTTLHSQQTLRSLEASAIRSKLLQHDNLHHDSIKKRNQKKASKRTVNDNHSLPVDKDDETRPKPWDVAHFPLSMSRYQREFKEITLLSSGSFGSVYRAIRELDGYEYAVKKITFDAMGYSNESIDQVIREVQCLAAVNDHPNIVRYYTSWWEPTWMTGSIPNKNRPSSVGGTSSKHQKYIENGSNANAKNGFIRNEDPNRKNNGNKFLQIEAGSSRIDDSTDNWSVESSSSSSSWSSDDDGYYSLDDCVGSNRDDTWEIHQNHDLEPWTKVHDDSYKTKTAYRRRRSNRKAKNTQTSSPYQYQISLYIQMQLCHPANLQDWIRERNLQIPESEHERRIGPALEIFHQICSGLSHIHKSNVVHRDLKPANIFVSSDGKVIKIGDFGLSKQLRDIVNNNSASAPQSKHSSPLRSTPPEQQSTKPIDTQRNDDAIISLSTRCVTSQALVERNKVSENLTSGIGTASYAAPEQVQSKTYGTAVDIFSLGLIFLELVSCFETEHERLHNLQQCRYKRLPKWIDSNYPDISSTILACTSLKASDRPTADELINLAKIKSPRNKKEINILKRQLVEKSEEIAEKNQTIENLRLEMERMRASLVPKKSSSLPMAGDRSCSISKEDVGIIVTDVLSFDHDIENELANR